MKIVILGLSITSSWGNGHATTYRALVRELAAAGHEVLFLERDVAWYAKHRDLANPPFCSSKLYKSLTDLQTRFAREVREADLVILGSYVPEGVEVGEWVVSVAEGVTAFYDIDTPVTMAKLREKDYEYLHPRLIPRYDMYLSFSGGPTLTVLEQTYGSPMARPLYCSVDVSLYYPEPQEPKWDLGYLGTYSTDRQPPLECLMLDAARKWPAGKFVVAGPLYPADTNWPNNVERIEHLAPANHCAFYNQQRFTQNITRRDMIAAGYSPSVRLFEAAACGTPIISDYWEGLDSFFEFDQEILIARTAADTLTYLHDITEEERLDIARRARARVLAEHTAAHRAQELISYVGELSVA